MNNTFRIYAGHLLEVAREIPEGSAQTAVTSFPYYGLRSYDTPPQVWDGHPLCPHQWLPIKQYKDSWRRGEASAGFHSDRGEPAWQERTRAETEAGRWTETEVCDICSAWRGELGQEPTVDLYIDHLVLCAAEVWRVLRPDGTFWANIGDAHYNYRPGKHDDARAQGYNRESGGSARDIPSFTAKRGYKLAGIKEKDLIGLPFRFFLAMQASGWYIRQTIIWDKANPLRESVTDRPTTAHEYIFMFSKKKRYYYDKWAITEEPTGNAHARTGKNGKPRDYQVKGSAPESRNNSSFIEASAGVLCVGGRNKGSVWRMNTQGYRDKHFAAFPEDLPETCIKAGSSEVGCCPSCRSPWRRIVLKPAKKSALLPNLEARWRAAAEIHGIDIEKAITGASITLGWEMACRCSYATPVPCVVFEPFAGRGTTIGVALRFGRSAVACELKPEYVEMSRQTANGEQPLWVIEEQATSKSKPLG